MRGDIIKARMIFNILYFILSQPCEFFDLNDLTNSVNSLADIGVHLILGNGLVNTCLT